MSDKLDVFYKVRNNEITMSKGAELTAVKLHEFRIAYNLWVAFWDGYRNASETILDTITEWGGIDGAHHKQWLLDLIVRKVTDHHHH